MTVEILIGDVRERLLGLPDDHFDCVVTSPPYWGLRDYGVAGQIGVERTLGEHLDVMVDVFREVRRVMKPTGSLWLNYGDCYSGSGKGAWSADDARKTAVKETYRPSGSTIKYVTGLKPKDLCMIPNRLAIALQEDGWWVRSEIVWGKPNAMPDSSGRYRPATSHEKIWLLSKTGTMFYNAAAVRMPAAEKSIARWQQDIDAQEGSARAYGGTKTDRKMKPVGGPSDKQRGHNRRHAGFNDRWDGMSKEEQQANGRLLRNYEPDPFQVLRLATAAFSEAHFATFPPDLAEICIRAGCPQSGNVLDIFGGAGTTGLVADRLGRDCTLIELNPEYAEMARARIFRDAPMFSNVSVAA